MKGAAVCVLLGLSALFVQRTSSVEEHRSGLPNELPASALQGHAGQTVDNKTPKGARAAKAGHGGQLLDDWKGARYTGRRSLKHGQYVVVQQDDSTPSPPPPATIIIKKSSAPSPPPPSNVIIKKVVDGSTPSPPPPSSTVIKKIVESSSAPSPPPPSKKVFNKFPFFPFGKFG